MNHAEQINRPQTGSVEPAPRLYRQACDERAELDAELGRERSEHAKAVSALADQQELNVRLENALVQCRDALQHFVDWCGRPDKVVDPETIESQHDALARLKELGIGRTRVSQSKLP